MWLERFQRYFLPGKIEHDPAFRRQIVRLSHIGLLVVGGVEIAVSAFMAAAYLALEPSQELFASRVITTVALVSLGLLTLALARVTRLHRYTRAIASISALLVAGVLTGSLLMMTQFDEIADTSIPVTITLIMLVSAAAIPFRPMDMLLFGFLMQSVYIVLAMGLQSIYHIGRGVDPIYVLFTFMVTLVATVLTVVIYEQRRSVYELHNRTVETAERLRQAEARNLLSENAASVGRLAAALSHELNSPIGVLVSGVDTLMLLAARQAHATEIEQPRLLLLQNELRKSIKLSTDRLREIVVRMQRFSNLDAAEVQEANVNDLIRDVAALLEPKYDGRVKVETDLQPMPPLVCRPQQLSAVFSNLMGNSIEAMNGDGQVRVSTRKINESVEVAFTDNGRGLNPKELNTIFDPEFRVSQGRVAAGNWSMFSSRQIVRDHGGEIRIESEPGKGTQVRVILPFQGNSHSIAPPS